MSRPKRLPVNRVFYLGNPVTPRQTLQKTRKYTETLTHSTEHTSFILKHLVKYKFPQREHDGPVAIINNSNGEQSPGFPSDTTTINLARFPNSSRNVKHRYLLNVLLFFVVTVRAGRFLSDFSELHISSVSSNRLSLVYASIFEWKAVSVNIFI